MKMTIKKNNSHHVKHGFHFLAFINEFQKLQYTLAQTSRINGKVKQSNILYLGSDRLLEDKNNRQLVLEMLKASIFKQPELFPRQMPEKLKRLALIYYEKYQIKYGQSQDNPTSIPPSKEQSEFHNTDIKGLEVEDVKEFGAEHLCKQTIEKLGLESFLKGLGLSDAHVSTSLISIAAKAIYAASEHKTAQILDINSELAACFGHSQPITHKQLYKVSDRLFQHKDAIDRYLYERLSSMFSFKDSLVIFDISNTYFETGKHQSKKAKYGRSKEKRSDCPLVVFTAVINREGFIRHSRIYEGNKADVATLEDMIKDLEANTTGAREKTIVIDAGIADDKNLELIDQKGYKYVCVSRKRLRDYTLGDTTSKPVTLTTKSKEKVELQIFHPQAYQDTWMYVESEGKRKKETSIDQKLSQRYLEELQSIKDAFSKKGGTKKTEKVWERIGRAKEKHKHVSARYKISVENQAGKAIDMKWEFVENKIKQDKSRGVYFIRTNHDTTSESKLWDVYNTIREVEATFRGLKTDLNIRPVHHQNDDRIDAHMYLTILAYQLVNTIRHMLKNNGINHGWKNIVRIMSTQKIQTIQIPTDKKVIYLRKPSKPINEVQQIYSATRCENTQKPIKKYVVYH
jgi:hypothetical protein